MNDASKELDAAQGAKEEARGLSEIDRLLLLSRLKKLEVAEVDARLALFHAEEQVRKARSDLASSASGFGAGPEILEQDEIRFKKPAEPSETEKMEALGILHALFVESPFKFLDLSHADEGDRRLELVPAFDWLCSKGLAKSRRGMAYEISEDGVRQFERPGEKAESTFEHCVQVFGKESTEFMPRPEMSRADACKVWANREGRGKVTLKAWPHGFERDRKVTFPQLKALGVLFELFRRGPVKFLRTTAIEDPPSLLLKSLAVLRQKGLAKEIDNRGTGRVYQVTAKGLSIYQSAYYVFQWKEKVEKDKREGRRARDLRPGNRKLTTEQRLEIRARRGEKAKDLGKEYGVDHNTIYNVWNGKFATPEEQAMEGEKA